MHSVCKILMIFQFLHDCIITLLSYYKAEFKKKETEKAIAKNTSKEIPFEIVISNEHKMLVLIIYQ